MLISSMLLTVMSVLLLGGIGKRSLSPLGIDVKHALFFFLCVAVLNRFTVKLTDDIELSCACILICVWLFGNAFSSGISKTAWMVLPAAAIIGLAFFSLAESSFYVIICLISVIAALIAGLTSGLAAAGLVPAFAFISAYIIGIFKHGYGLLEMTERCLITQLAGIFFAASAFLIKNSIKKTYSKFSRMHAN